MKMKLIASSMLALTFSGALFSAESMSVDAVKSLLTNNTINCKNFQMNHESNIYFRDDGTATRLNHEREKIPGKWRVTDNGQHCVDWGEDERCNSVVDQGNGTYQKIEEDKLPDGSRVADAFVYPMRMWSPAELSDALREAGFPRFRVYRKTSELLNDDNSFMSPVETVDEPDSWEPCIVGFR
jgi:hypothetical protein